MGEFVWERGFVFYCDAEFVSASPEITVGFRGLRTKSAMTGTVTVDCHALISYEISQKTGGLEILINLRVKLMILSTLEKKYKTVIYCK